MQRNLKRNATSSQTTTARRGVTTVEFALCSSILFLFFFAQVEFSRANMVRNGLRSACYHGCREGIVVGATTADVRQATEKTLIALGLREYTVTITPATITNETQAVTVAVSASLTANSWVTPIYTNGTVLDNEMTMERELVDQLIY
ncbi:MAG: TadE/TadG family type IV pilus assembly protein [Planctomycetaceae bacterium]|jgi:Flp pilus assembly protein TadG|nr:pilus assembly protein [Planctomycetaceae bacterium]MDG2389607.1 TadE/TadG family type IV pilus assembly protein [Planctomycetaceae bacterium]